MFSSSKVELIIKNVNFEYNLAIRHSNHDEIDTSSLIYVAEVRKLLFESCNFSYNIASDASSLFVSYKDSMDNTGNA